MHRALLTGVSQLYAKISEYNAQQLNTDVVEVTAHAGARPEHAAWQGGWYSLTGKDKRYKDLRTETGYGTGAGLMGWNCRHTFFPVIPGIDEPKYTKEELENIDPPPVEIKGKTYTYYEAEQRQRFIERSMRELQREIYAAQASGDEQQYKARVNYLRLKTTQYVDFCKDAGLLPRPQRYGAIGVGRVVSKEANWSKVIGNNALNSLRTAPKTAKKERPAVVNVPSGTNGGTGKIYSKQNISKNTESIDYMSKSFRPKFELSEPLHFRTKSNKIQAIPVKRISNSEFELYASMDTTRRNKAVRMIEQQLKEIRSILPANFDFPKVVLVDFDSVGFNSSAIGGYDHETGILYFNSKYNSKKLIRNYVNKIPGNFANTTEYAPLLHELGHKFYEDFVKSLAKSENISYNRAKDIIDNRIYDYIHEHNFGSNLGKEISDYAQIGYDQHNYTEIIAECFSSMNTNSTSKEILDLMR